MNAVQVHIAMHGEPFELRVVANAGSKDYNPASDTDFAPGAGAPSTVQGAFSKGEDEGPDVVGLVLVETVPAGIVADSSTAKRVNTGETFMIGKIRPRSWKGTTNGWTLVLRS